MKALSDYKGIIRALDPSGFQKLGRGSDSKKAAVLYDNLWGLFGLGKERRALLKEKLEREGVPLWSVGDFAWTPEVRDAFYAHPYHRQFIKRIKSSGGMTWGLWVLDCEPACIDGETGEVAY